MLRTSLSLLLLVLSTGACSAPRAAAPAEEGSAPSPAPREEDEVAPASSADAQAAPAPGAEAAAARRPSEGPGASTASATSESAPSEGATSEGGADAESVAAGASATTREGTDEPAGLAALPPYELCGPAALQRARAAFLALDERERRELIDYFQLECSNLGTFQMQLVSFVLGSQDVDPASWPTLQPLRWFEPAVHAPAQPIPRRPLPADAPETVAMRNAVLGAFPARPHEPGWLYDWGTRSLVRVPCEDELLRVFENGLAGMPPGWDLVEALVERALDDGSQQKALAAFSHAYTDRNGGVVPGVTLYDAHASRTVLEMPDVDCLGLVHDIAGDWTTWVAVIRVDQQQPLYAKVAELFADPYHHRSLRTALARCFLTGSPVLRDGYQGHVDNFHALWDKHASTPASLGRALPSAAAWSDFLQGWHDELLGSSELATKGLARRAALDQGALRVREALFYVLDQVDAYARIERMPTFDR